MLMKSMPELDIFLNEMKVGWDDYLRITHYPVAMKGTSLSTMAREMIQTGSLRVDVLEEDYPFINKEAKRFADTQEERKRLSEEEMKRLIQFGCNVHETTDDDDGD